LPFASIVIVVGSTQIDSLLVCILSSRKKMGLYIVPVLCHKAAHRRSWIF